MGQTPEGKVKAMVKKRLDKEWGRKCYRFMPVQGGFGSVSLDFLLSVYGLFVAIETKAPGKKPTALQETTMQAIRDAGGLVFVVDDEPSMDKAIADIHLKLRFDTNAPRHERASFNAIREAHGDPNLTWDGALLGTEEAERQERKYESSLQPAQEAYSATRRDHGSPRTKPQRRSVAGSRQPDQRTLEERIDEILQEPPRYCTCGGFYNSTPHKPTCPRYKET